MYLSYSGFKKDDECPRSYFHQYIDKTPIPEPDNRVNMVYGQVVGVCFEEFYRDKLWKLPDPAAAMLIRAPIIMEETLAKEKSRGGVFNWKESRDYKSSDAVLKDVNTAIPRGLQIIRHHGLLGVDAKAEVKLDQGIQGHILGGRADFIMHRAAPNGDLVILDGKGSKYRDAYADVRQLYWYALLYRARTGILPDRAAFVFWRSEPETALDWYPVTPDVVDQLQETVLKSISVIETASKKRLPQLRDAFEAKPTEGRCRFCSYVFACPAGKNMVSKDRPVFSKPEGVEDVGME